ncbi:MAG: DUF1295 domain-containing protein [Maricaulaceae bacterium]
MFLLNLTHMKKDFIPIIIAYIAVFIVGGGLLCVLPYGVLVNTLVADIAATFVIFAFGRVYKNSSFYDAYWSVIPPAIAAYWYYVLGTDANAVRAMIVIALTVWWGARLTINWASHWEGMTHEDWRYPPIRERAGKLAPLADLMGIHMFPTLIVFASCLPIYAVMKYGSAPLGVFDYIAFAVTAAAILIETFSDIQLHNFIKIKEKGEFIKTGLWRYSRHPNYFGEFGFWFGLALCGLAAHPNGWMWIIPGAAAMGAMFAFVSIPLMDERSLASRDGYTEHMKRTSAFILWPPKA